MMRSLFSAVSGLRNHQTRMDVIGNNIANVNTVGFKKSRVNFQDMLSQTIRGAGSPQGGRGGTNPQQVGLGMTVSALETVMTGTSVQSTGKNSDLAISGDGFFIVTDGTGNYYTRDGSFNPDQNFNLVNANGLKVKGYLYDYTKKAINYDDLVPIDLSSYMQMEPKASQKATFVGNLDARLKKDETVTRSMTIYDSQGNAHDLQITFTKLGDPGTAAGNSWHFKATCEGADDGSPPPSGPVPYVISGTIDFDKTGSSYLGGTEVSGLTVGVLKPGTGDLNGYTITYNNPTGFFRFGASPTVDDINAVYTETNGDELPLLDLTGITQHASESTVSAFSTDGYPRGDLQTYSFDASGVLTVAYSNGRKMQIAQIAVATCSNPTGLTKVAENLYQESNNSGTMNAKQPGAGGAGTIIPGSLEMSNVDLSQEFSDMIITQRGFQANSRIITVSDTMLEELINLKR